MAAGAPAWGPSVPRRRGAAPERADGPVQAGPSPVPAGGAVLREVAGSAADGGPGESPTISPQQPVTSCPPPPHCRPLSDPRSPSSVPSRGARWSSSCRTGCAAPAKDRQAMGTRWGSSPVWARPRRQWPPCGRMARRWAVAPSIGIGWHLGGSYARERRKLQAPHGRQVIAIATPLNTTNGRSNVGWLHRLLVRRNAACGLSTLLAPDDGHAGGCPRTRP